MIDAHVHVWGQDLLRYPFGPHDGLAAPEEARTVQDFLADAGGAGVRGMILIQPRVYGYDHAYLFEVANHLDSIGSSAQPGEIHSGEASRSPGAPMARVMPLVNVVRPSAVEEMTRLAALDATAAIRIIALGDTLADWLCSSDAHRAWEAAGRLGLPIGMLVDPNQLSLVSQMARDHVGLSIVVDHMGRCSPGLQARYGRDLLSLADRPNIFVKLSAMGSLSDMAFPYADMAPLVESLYGEFGPSRLLWGSDWPHVGRNGTYDHATEAMGRALALASGDDLESIFDTTAARLFGLDPPGTGGSHANT